MISFVDAKVCPLRFVQLPTENRTGNQDLIRYRLDHLHSGVSRIYVLDDVLPNLQTKDAFPFQIAIPICWLNENYRDVIRLEFTTREARDKAFHDVVNLLNAG